MMLYVLLLQINMHLSLGGPNAGDDNISREIARVHGSQLIRQSSRQLQVQPTGADKL